MNLKNFLIFLCLFHNLNAFIPAKVIEFLIEKADHSLKEQFGEISRTYTHEEIIREGVIRSTVKFFSEQKHLTHLKLNLNRIEKYFNLNKLYGEIYNKSFCRTDLEDIIVKDLQPSVASVDFDEDTKDMPYAHFDANTFLESNRRVINMTQRVIKNIEKKKYERARELSGKVLHTIHDFYSHSNWIEMGNYNKINSAIGTEQFNKFKFSSKSDNLTCIANCTIKQINCNKIISTMIMLIKNLRNSSISCPIKYYTCEGNIIYNDRLTSGYYVDQKLPDGSEIRKPDKSFMCSHGGVLDSDSFKPAEGGINKDSGYYLFSPHANLHLIAAKLAINHTEYFFNQIRAKVGDEEFSKFLRLRLHHSFINKLNNIIEICSGYSARYNSCTQFKQINTISLVFSIIFSFFFLEKF
ncbi:unnamed protein product [Brachionus calyciflorus]|uniref:VWA7 N-terminal domain-containing protein n=1 Tax=Brachionus calyciflorus TaxID=104777 RepID=A0A813XKJ9_9BILA|nr:unnamed protein product [Brachionus calyciflorus]